MILLLCVVWHRIESPFAHVCFVLFFFKSLINFSWSRAGQPMAVSRKKPRSIVRMAQSVQAQQTNDCINQLRGGIYHKLSASPLVCPHSAPHEVAASNPRVASFYFCRLLMICREHVVPLVPHVRLVRSQVLQAPRARSVGWVLHIIGNMWAVRVPLDGTGPTCQWEHVGGVGPMGSTCQQETKLSG